MAREEEMRLGDALVLWLEGKVQSLGAIFTPYLGDNLVKRTFSPLIVLIVTSATFLIYGIFNAGVGPLLSELSAQTNSSLASIGVIFTALYAGSMLTQLISGTLIDRFGRKPLFVVSILVFALGILGITQTHSLTALLLWGFLSGLGQGGIDLGANLIVANAYQKNNVAALNILHLAFGLGAAIGPALVSLSLVEFDRGMPVLSGTVILFTIAALLSIYIRMDAVRSIVNPGQPDSGAMKSVQGVYTSPLLWILGVLLLLVVGAQFGIGSWSSVYIKQTTSYNAETAALITSGFWAMITVGRIVAAAISKRFTPRKMLFLNLTGSLIGGLALAFSHEAEVPTIVALLLTGLCYGGLYPVVISIATMTFASNSGKAASVIVTMGTIGGLTVPTLAGLVLENISSVAYTWMIVIVLGTMLLLYFIVPRDLIERDKSVVMNRVLAGHGENK